LHLEVHCRLVSAVTAAPGTSILTPVSLKWLGMNTMRSFNRTRFAFTLVELLVVIAILAVLMGLLLPAVQKIRETAYRTRCTNNLRQIGAAVHNYITTIGSVPAEGAGPTSNGGPGDLASVFFNVLPFLEQNAVYQCSAGAGQALVLDSFLCPSDTTAASAPIVSGLALGSYNYTVHVAGNGNSGVFPAATMPPSRSLLNHVCRDGTSSTIMMGEHVRVCGGSGGGSGGGPGGGNPWGTTANKRVFGSLSIMSPRAIAVAVSPGNCTTPPNPAPGVAWFSTGHPTSLNFLMADGSVTNCSANVDVISGLIPALTSAAGDIWNGF